MSSRLISQVTWERIPVGAGAAIGHVDLTVGRVSAGGNSTVGPVALICAGIHGDEGPWGAWAIRKLLERTPTDELRGTLRVIPMANPLALEADARNAPLDMLDLNRVFPGDSNGSHTERLAAAIAVHGVDGANVVIDIHGGGSWCVNAFVFSFPGGEPLAAAVGAPFVVSGPERAVTLTGYARTRGAAVTAIEMGGRSASEESWADRIASGLRAALGTAGVLTPATDLETADAIAVGPSTVLRPTRGGMFMPRLNATHVGKVVPGGTILGHLLDPVTYHVIETFSAPFPQTALLLLRPMLARIEGGAMTYVVAEPKAAA